MYLPPELMPTEPHKVMDLVADTGLDVSDWANMKGGAAKAASNPKYCYEWAYVDPENKFVVLNLWYAGMRDEAGRVVQRLNARNTANRQGNGTGKRRALRMDAALQLAFHAKLPVRAIVCDGIRRGFEGANTKASRVTNRILDPLRWTVISYAQRSGKCVIERGDIPGPYSDQFSIPDAVESSVERRLTTRSDFLRSEVVRENVLNRARGRCELCKVPGFQRVAGGTYLETHHVIPLAENGLDRESNVVALCANHHREAHYGANALSLRDRLRSIIAGD